MGCGGKWRGLELKQVSLKAGRKEEQTNLHGVGSARAAEPGGHGKVLMQRWKETARATRKEIRVPLSQCSNSSPPQTPAPSCGCSLPPSYCLGMQNGLCCLPGLTTSHQRQLSVAAPTPALPVPISPWSEHFPHCGPSPLAGLTGEGKSFKAKTVRSSWYKLKLFPQDLEPKAHLEVNAALQSVPTLASMPALKCAGFLPFMSQLLKVFLDVQSLRFTPWHTGFYINHDFFH